MYVFAGKANCIASTKANVYEPSIEWLEKSREKNTLNNLWVEKFEKWIEISPSTIYQHKQQ